MKLLKLHLRDLFWLLLACGFALGWWAERRQLIDRVTAAEKRTSEAELEAFYYVQSANMAGLKLPLIRREDTVLGEQNPYALK